MSFRLKPLVVALFASQLTACAVGPDYIRPQAPVASEFKEIKGWKTAQPRDTAISGQWWEIFNDPKLNELESQVASNQSLIQAEAQYRQAQGLVQSAQSSLLPVFNLNGSFNNFKSAQGQTQVISGVRTLFGNTVAMAWEPDLWGKVRRQIEANTGNAQASAATLQALRLSIQSNLAVAYFQLKVLDAQKTLLDETVAAYQKTLDITKNRYAVGVVAKADVVQAETQLQSAKAQAINLGVQRAKLEHAIAVLIGKSPAELSLAASALTTQAPAIPLSLPSELLERRPDIAAAERKVAAANAQIGIAKAAYFPTLNLAMSNGFQSTDVGDLFTVARRYWAFGPAAAALTVFDGGVKNAQYNQAIAGFDASVAAYRQAVLTGFQEVEDNLAALRILEEQAQVQDQAVASANQALALTNNQYQAGTVSYLNVMTAQTAALSNRQTAVQLQGDRLNAAVLLVKALGGGWNETLMPTEEQAAGERKWTDYLILPVDTIGEWVE
jgi:NodT family efflux transporter outer membrane factor (OMF) lipoprotein